MHGKASAGFEPLTVSRGINLSPRRSKRQIRIFIVSGQTIFRDGLLALLKRARDFSVVGQAADGEMAISLAQRLKPDVVLLDLKLPKPSGIDVLRRLAEAGSAVRVLVFSSDIGSNETIQALHLGARGIVLNGSPSPMLFEGIRRVMADEYWVSPDTIASLVQRLRRPLPYSSSVQPASFGLTARELEVILEVVAGSSNPEIAKKLCLSEQTVKHHLTHVFDKLGVYNRVELALFATNHNLSAAAGAFPE
jgi:two-component system, NarL family, nitrate/nitrite response regulator NarL